MLSSKRVIPLPRIPLVWPEVFTPDGQSPKILKTQEKQCSHFPFYYKGIPDRPRASGSWPPAAPRVNGDQSEILRGKAKAKQRYFFSPLGLETVTEGLQAVMGFHVTSC